MGVRIQVKNGFDKKSVEGHKFWGYVELEDERDSRHYLGVHTIDDSGISPAGREWICCCNDEGDYSNPEWFSPFILTYNDFKEFIQLYYKDCEKYNIPYKEFKEKIDKEILSVPGYKIIEWY